MQTTQKTYSPKASEVTHAWRLVNAEGQTLGRLATQIALFLRGKHLPNFAEHMDLGDFVVVINASRIHLTGNKATQRMYYRHSTYPGGLKSVPLGEVLAKHPERVIKHSVRFKEAPAAGLSIIDYAPEHEGAEAYRALARELLR